MPIRCLLIILIGFVGGGRGNIPFKGPTFLGLTIIVCVVTVGLTVAI